MPVTVILKGLDELGLTELLGDVVYTTSPTKLLPSFVNSLNMDFSAELRTIFGEVNVTSNLDVALTNTSNTTDISFESIQYNSQLKRIEFIDHVVNEEDFTVRTPKSFPSRLDLNATIENGAIKKVAATGLTKTQLASPTFKGITGSILPSEISLWQVLSRLKQAGKNNKRFETYVNGSNPLTVAGNYDPNSWAYSLDTTGIPVCNNLFHPTYSQANMGGLIAPRVGFGVGHWTGNFYNGAINTFNNHGVSNRNHTVGNTVVFKDKNNQTFTRTIVASYNYSYIGYSANTNHVSSVSNPNIVTLTNEPSAMDLVMYLLDDELPSSITPLKLLGSNFVDANKLFYGGGIRMNQFNQIDPVFLCNSTLQNGQLLKNNFERDATNSIPAGRRKSFNESFRSSPIEQPLLSINIWSPILSNSEVIGVNPVNNLYTEQYQFIGSLFNRNDLYPQAAKPVDVGDSGTPILYVGDGGKLALSSVVSGNAPFTESNYPWVVAQIDALRNQALDTRPVTYPQIMTPPTDTSVVTR